jgi:hypothetical protein
MNRAGALLVDGRMNVGMAEPHPLDYWHRPFRIHDIYQGLYVRICRGTTACRRCAAAIPAQLLDPEGHRRMPARCQRYDR